MMTEGPGGIIWSAMTDLFEQHSEVLDRFEDEERIDEREVETVDQVLHASLHFVAALVEWASANFVGNRKWCMG